MSKLKDKVIKWLGGYTEDEYQTALSLGTPPALPPLFGETYEPVSLHVSYSYPDDACDRAEALRRARAQVKVGLQDAAIPYMVVRSTMDPTSRTITLEGSLKVMKRSHTDA